MEFAHPQVVSTRIVRSGQPDVEALYRPGGYDDVLLRMEAQELRGWQRISEEIARSELESMEREARRSFFYQAHQLRRQGREALSRAARES